MKGHGIVESCASAMAQSGRALHAQQQCRAARAHKAVAVRPQNRGMCFDR